MQAARRRPGSRRPSRARGGSQRGIDARVGADQWRRVRREARGGRRRLRRGRGADRPWRSEASARTGSKSCRTTPNAKSRSNWSPRAEHAHAARECRCPSARARPVLPIPAGPRPRGTRPARRALGERRSDPRQLVAALEQRSVAEIITWARASHAARNEDLHRKVQGVSTVRTTVRATPGFTPASRARSPSSPSPERSRPHERDPGLRSRRRARRTGLRIGARPGGRGLRRGACRPQRPHRPQARR